MASTKSSSSSSLLLLPNLSQLASFGAGPNSSKEVDTHTHPYLRLLDEKFFLGRDVVDILEDHYKCSVGPRVRVIEQIKPRDPFILIRTSTFDGYLSWHDLNVSVCKNENCNDAMMRDDVGDDSSTTVENIITGTRIPLLFRNVNDPDGAPFKKIIASMRTRAACDDPKDEIFRLKFGEFPTHRSGPYKLDFVISATIKKTHNDGTYTYEGLRIAKALEFEKATIDETQTPRPRPRRNFPFVHDYETPGSSSSSEDDDSFRIFVYNNVFKFDLVQVTYPCGSGGGGGSSADAAAAGRDPHAYQKKMPAIAKFMATYVPNFFPMTNVKLREALDWLVKNREEPAGIAKDRRIYEPALELMTTFQEKFEQAHLDVYGTPAPNWDNVRS